MQPTDPSLEPSNIPPEEPKQQLKPFGDSFAELNSSPQAPLQQTQNPSFNHVPAPVQPVATPQPTLQPAGSVMMGGEPAVNKPKKRVFIFSALLTILLLAGMSGFVFGFYLPNRPEAIWKTGLNRTSEEMDAFVAKLSDPATFEAIAKSKVSVKGFVKTKDSDVNVSIDSTYDKISTDNAINIEGDVKFLKEKVDIEALVKTQIVDGSPWPNIYLNVSGLTFLGLDEFLPGLSQYEGKWLAIEQDLYKQFIDSGEMDGGQTPEENITQQDVIGILADAVEVTNEYVFTTDPEKAVLVMNKFVAAEESEGINANRYEAAINQENATKYCVALITKMYDNETYKQFIGLAENDLQESLENEKKACDKPTEKVTGSDQYKDVFDIWIDKKSKLIHKLRLTEDFEKRNEQVAAQKDACLDSSNRRNSFGQGGLCGSYDELMESGESYLEIGQIYQGGDNIKLFMTANTNTNLHKDSMRADLSINIENIQVSGKISYKDESEDNSGLTEVTINTEPFDGEVDAKKPAGAISIMEAYEKLLNAQMQGRSLSATTEPSSNVLKFLQSFTNITQAN